MKKIIVGLLIGGFLHTALAQKTDEATPSSVRDTLRSNLKGAPVDNVRKSPVPNLWEFSIDGDVLYTDSTGRYLFEGRVIDLNSGDNLTEARSLEINKVDFTKLPLNQAIKTVRGNGKRVVAIFADPNCGYCKRIEKDIQNVDNVTIYTFLYPILSADSQTKSKQIWCSADKQKAWDDWMLRDKAPTGDGNCDNPVSKTFALGQQLRVRGTPTLIFPDGKRIPGAISSKQFEAALDQSLVTKK